MGCFFACFRIKDDDRPKTHLVSNSISPKSRDPVVSKNQLASVFLCEEKDSPSKQVAHLSSQDDNEKDSVDRDIQHEAKFLKSCGALLNTPPEIRKASPKLIVPSLFEDDASSNFHAWLPGVSYKKHHWDEQLDQISISPAQIHEGSGFPGNKSQSCISEEHQTLSNYDSASSSVTFEHPSAAAPCKSKSKHFEGVKSRCGVESVMDSATLDISPPQVANQVQTVCSKYSPYPTPLKLTDEMQTPGTIYPAGLENFRSGKNTRIRTQYVYPDLNPVENLSEWKAVREDSNQLGQSSGLFEKQIKSAAPEGWERTQHISLTYGSPRLLSPNEKRSQNSEMIPIEKSVSGGSPNYSTTGYCMSAPSYSREQVNFSPSPHLVVTSLSQWLKPPLNDMGGMNIETNSKERSHSRKSPDGDRPILGTVAAHWNDDEPSHISPKWWDGKGIPNSTNKYKEDQKVSWHATPFEERLEKALSDEKLFPQRKVLNGKPIEFEDEGEESDTAAS